MTTSPRVADLIRERMERKRSAPPADEHAQDVAAPLLHHAEARDAAPPSSATVDPTTHAVTPDVAPPMPKDDATPHAPTPLVAGDVDDSIARVSMVATARSWSTGPRLLELLEHSRESPRRAAHIRARRFTLPVAPAFDDAAHAVACPYSSAPCEVAAEVLEHMPSPDPVQASSLTRSLPCLLCRGCDAAADNIRAGVRLGLREREILIEANVDEGLRVTEGITTRAACEARLRAVRRLRDLGLVRTRTESVKRRREGIDADVDHAIRIANLTPFADELSERYRDEWIAGRRVRWDTRVDDAQRAARRDVPALVEQTWATHCDLVMDLNGEQHEARTRGDESASEELRATSLRMQDMGDALHEAIWRVCGENTEAA